MNKINYLTFNWLAQKLNNENQLFVRSYIKGTVYDLGCGERPYEEDILKVADKYIGVDWGGTLHNLKADIVSDLNKPLPIDSEVADTVTSFQVMEHLCEPQTMLNEAYRILKKGGNIVLTVPFQWWVHEAPYDYFRYTPYGLKYMFEKAGFEDIRVTPNTGFFIMWILKMNYFSSRFIRGPRPLRWIIKAVLIPIWFIFQVLAPLLDKLDRHPELEAGGYTVLARKK
ncbi:methyltransferase domain-containing protein [Wolinella succinogenes]|uniref:methyltransferase domain-containing protein n=1 Tax=Wolinella succinogenes TaxID=844 RepID=UPI00240900C1|nr:methyltransferase domain-containing protein [Wolinella succinogenes]